MDSVFFGNSGLTSTSANHIANLAKEFVQDLENKLKSIKFINTSVSLIGNSDKNVLSEGVDDTTVETIPAMLESIGMANSLIAWLREAIKAREAMLKEVKNMSIEEWAAMTGVKLPSEPTHKAARNKDERIAQRNIKERNRIYALQCKAAVIGKYIHPDGKFADARQELMEKLHDKHEVSGNGRDTLLYHYKPSCSSEVVEKIFFRLQAEHRAIQAELNGIFHSVEEEIREENLSLLTEWQSAMQAYNAEYTGIYAEYKKYIEGESGRRAELRIVIPNDLQDIYQEINQLGK